MKFVNRFFSISRNWWRRQPQQWHQCRRHFSSLSSSPLIVIHIAKYFSDAAIRMEDVGEEERAVPLFDAAAVLGDQYASYRMGAIYFEGLYGFQYDPDKIVKYMRRAMVDKVYLQAPHFLQTLGATLVGSYADDTALAAEGYAYIKKAADNFNAIDSRCRVALCLYYGVGVERDLYEALCYFYRLWVEGDGFYPLFASAHIARIYFDLSNVKERGYLRAEAEDEMSNASHSLGWYRVLVYGYSSSEISDRDMLNLWLHGVYSLAYDLLNYYAEEKKGEIAREVFLLGSMGVSKEHEDGEFYPGFLALLGSCYATGYHVAIDYEKAVQFNQRAVDLGAYSACHNLGSLYYYGHGVEQDMERAFNLFLQGADAVNDMQAMLAVAWCYFYGLGVEHSDADYVYWLERAAAAGEQRESFFNLGEFFVHGGETVAKDVNQAAYYYLCAMKTNDPLHREEATMRFAALPRKARHSAHKLYDLFATNET